MVSFFMDNNNNKLLQGYDLLNNEMIRHSTRVEKFKLKPICNIYLDDERKYSIQKKISELLSYHKVAFELIFISRNKLSINIESAIFSDLLDMLEVILYDKGVELYKADVYWHEDREKGHVMADILLDITAC
ncbi:hypothetical protein AT01_1661 [Yersinia aldovae 670-83]|nr:hypothetical protein AT01_1661 [Yersinia aldovae 670-83]